ncbi:hypothetical protein A5715_06620 [Mycolicibacter heraklionensis]|nr:hypothetical protein A5715_06620 [Mycolicibacter heraklionensis]
MTEPRDVLHRLTAECHALSWQLYRVSTELAELDRQLHSPAPQFVPTAPIEPAAPMGPAAPTMGPWAPASMPARPASTTALEPKPVGVAGDSGWIGKVLAVAGVAVTLVGVVLLLVLAAQAGILRPQIRVAGGFVLSAALVGAACRLHSRSGGRIGAIAVAATGIAAAYLDIIAITAYYQWIPAAAGLAIAAAAGGAGLALARSWNSEHLGVLVLVPLIGLAPILTGDVDLLLIGFLLALSAAALPMQVGKDWTAMFAARTAAATLALLLALVGIGEDNRGLLAAACAVGAVLALVSGLVVLPTTSRPAAIALLTAAGTLPVLAAGGAVDQVPATVLAATLSLVVLAVIGVHRALPPVVVQVFSALSAVAALIAVATAFHGSLLAPVLLAMAVVVAAAGRRSGEARWVATGFGFVGVIAYLDCVAPDTLISATKMSSTDTVSTLIASLLVIALVVVMARAYALADNTNPANTPILAVAGGALIGYAVTAFTVTAGVAIGGTGGGFLTGHMAATLCWIVMAAALLRYALRLDDRGNRTWAITAGLALTAAATAKLFLFDLGTLDGMFRVAAFIVAGLLLLGMGTGYARSLAQQDDR